MIELKISSTGKAYFDAIREDLEKEDLWNYVVAKIVANFSTAPTPSESTAGGGGTGPQNTDTEASSNSETAGGGSNATNLPWHCQLNGCGWAVRFFKAKIVICPEHFEKAKVKILCILLS